MALGYTLSDLRVPEAVMSRLKGVIAPIATPTDSKGRFIPEPMQALLEYLLDDLDAVFVRGTSGEFAALRDPDAEAALRTVVDKVNGRCPVIVGIGDTSTPRTLERTQAVADSGADYVAVTTPYYYDPSAAELMSHFVTVADRSPLPVLLYQIPQNTHAVLPVSGVLELATHANVAGIKDSSGDYFAFQEILADRPRGFVVFQGREQLASSSLLAGADGVISALANIAPRLLRHLCDAAGAHHAERAHHLQQEVTELARLFQEGHWLAALKAALEEMGFAVGPPVPPLAPLRPHARARVRAHLAAAGLGVVQETAR